MQKSFKANLKHVPFKMSPVDIIIPFYEQHKQVALLVESIIATVRTNRYRISLVDDASPNETFIERMKKIDGVGCFRHEKKMGFGACITTALQNTEQPWILIVKPEITVVGNTWLSNLGESLAKLKQKNIKIISPMTDNIDDVRLKGTKDTKRENIILMEGCLPLYCALAHRELFARVGEIRSPEDFAQRMRSQGFYQAVCGRSFVKTALPT